MTINTFRQAQDYLNEIPCINSGGCGIAALALARWRRAHGLKVKAFALLDDDEWEHESNQQAVELDDPDSVAIPTHVAVVIGGRLYDSNGSNAHESCGTAYEISVGESLLVEIINTGGATGWNSSFSRERWVPETESVLDIDLSDIEIYTE